MRRTEIASVGVFRYGENCGRERFGCENGRREELTRETVVREGCLDGTCGATRTVRLMPAICASQLKKDYMTGMTDSVDLVPIGGYFGKGKRWDVLSFLAKHIAV